MAGPGWQFAPTPGVGGLFSWARGLVVRWCEALHLKFGLRFAVWGLNLAVTVANSASLYSNTFDKSGPRRWVLGSNLCVWHQP